MDTREVREFAQGLIELGTYLAERPEVLVHPYHDVHPLTLLVPCSRAEQLGRCARLLGEGEKYSDGNEIYSSTGVRRSFGPHKIDVYMASSQVCTPKRTETRTFPVVELDAAARAEIEAIRERHTRMEAREVVTEWACPPSFLALEPTEPALEPSEP